MREGEIVEIGPCDQFYDRPVHPYSRDLLSALN
jgi:ABC-type oligopeptide transport system ATPase subunit